MTRIMMPRILAGMAAALFILVPARAFPCGNSTDIVGHGECEQFGDWSVARLPRIRIELGSSMHTFSLAGMSFSGRAENGQSINYQMPDERMGSAGEAKAWTSDLRVTTAIGRYGYAGGQVTVGAVKVQDPQPMNNGLFTMEPDNGLYVTVGAVGGLAYYMGRWTLRSEAQVGRRIVTLDVATHDGDRVDQSSIHDQQWQLRPQVAVESWLSPWITAGAALSTDMLHEGDMTMGVYIGGHLRAYDSSRRRR